MEKSMSAPPFPIQLMASTHRRYTERAPGLLDLIMKNLSTETPITARIEVTGEMTGEWIGPPCLVAANGHASMKIPTIPMPLGDYLLTVRVTLELDDGTSICMCGQIDRAVEANFDAPRDIHVNVTNSVDGTGFIDASELKMPTIPTQGVQKSDQPTYEEVPLKTNPLAGCLSNCILEDSASHFRLHMLTGEQVILGRSVEEADIVAPLPNERVSRKNCSINRTEDGFWIENLSNTNPPRLNDTEVRGQTELSSVEDSRITLGGQVSYKVHSIADTGLGKEIKKHLVQRGIRCIFPQSNSDEPAALLFVQEKVDAIPFEVFLWVFQPVLLANIPLLPFITKDIALAAIPHLVSVQFSEAGKVRVVTPVVEHRHVGKYIARPKISCTQ
jgi:FHA domain-containing protein